MNNLNGEVHCLFLPGPPYTRHPVNQSNHQRNMVCEQEGLHRQRHGFLTVLHATQVLGASDVRANSGVSVVHQVVLVGAFEARADHV